MAIYAGLQSLSIYSIQIWIFVLINGRFSNRKKILIKDFLFLLKFIFSFFPSDTAFVLAAVYQKDISEEIFGHFGQKMDAFSFAQSEANASPNLTAKLRTLPAGKAPLCGCYYLLV